MAADRNGLQRFEESKSLLRKTLPVARRVSGKNDELTLNLGWNYADALYTDPDATLDDIREAVRTLEDLEQTTRRVFGGAHPFATGIVDALRQSRATLRAREAGKRVVFQYT